MNDVSDHKGGRSSLIAQAVIFGFAVVIVTGAAATIGDLSVADRDLLDSDGYMRYLRVADLATSGEWYDSVSERSNAPYGEILHWTRPLDLYVLALVQVVSLFAVQDPLYWGSLISGPSLLFLLGLVSYWSFSSVIRSPVKRLLMPALLAIPLVVSYLGAGRVDHHGLLLIMLVMTIGVLLRGLRDPAPLWGYALGGSLAMGLWISTEFLVPWFLTAATVALVMVRAGQDTGRFGIRTWAAASGTTLAFLLIERGTVRSTEFDRISIVHVAIAALATVGFAVMTWWHSSRSRSTTGSRGYAVLALTGLGSVAVLLFLFPDLVGGPFVAVDAFVMEHWLSEVTELQPVAGQSVSSILFRLLPMVLGGMGGVWAIQRTAEEIARRDLIIVLGWMVAYFGLACLQFRWALFGHVLALPLLLAAIGPMYSAVGDRFVGVLVRPVVVAGLLSIPLLSAAVPSVASNVESGCSLDPAIPYLKAAPDTIVLADQDIGPQILYRTDHDVVATPYHRNASGLRFLFDVMSSRDLGFVRSAVEQRGVGLILVCPGQVSAPEKPEGTMYGRLMSGPLPEFIEEVPLPADTDYRLFSVES